MRRCDCWLLPPRGPLRQFAVKGFDALLDAARIVPDLHLTLLWRGVLTDEIRQRIADRELRRLASL